MKDTKTLLKETTIIFPETLHDQSGTVLEGFSNGLLIYFVYRYIKCLFITKSLTSAFIEACLGDYAPFIFVPFLIAIIIYFIDWAIYTLIKKKVIRSGKTYNGIITKEIK